MSLLELADFSHFCWENQHQITVASPHKVLSSGDKLAYKYQPNQPNQPNQHNHGYSAMVTINPVRFVCKPTNGFVPGHPAGAGSAVLGASYLSLWGLESQSES